MKTYIGAKLIKGEPMHSDQFLIQYGKNAGGDGPGYHVQYPGGYHSWSPAAVFEQAYREVSGEEREMMKR